MFANENTMQHMSMTTYFRGMPSPETLTQIASKYRRVIIFVDFNNISRGFYKPEIIVYCDLYGEQFIDSWICVKGLDHISVVL